jgi:hypothetical protein
MKARLAVLVVAIALAVGGVLHHARGQASRSAVPGSPPGQIELMTVDPGGWWDWH